MRACSAGATRRRGRDFHDGMGVTRTHADRDFPHGIRAFHRVVQEVDGYLFQRRRIGTYEWARTACLHAERSPADPTPCRDASTASCPRANRTMCSNSDRRGCCTRQNSSTLCISDDNGAVSLWMMPEVLAQRPRRPDPVHLQRLGRSAQRATAASRPGARRGRRSRAASGQLLRAPMGLPCEARAPPASA